ncbi:cytochrome P450 [Streptomyces sp. NPDC093108]|uniref:cytochrome P450 n=1 Tax=Streptomyces sp. NPDC093108 TaxID=3366030 RepID=UPI0037F1F76E
MFDPPAELVSMRESGPVIRLMLPSGKEGWLITRFNEAKSVLSDARFSSANRGASNPVSEVPDELIEETTIPGLFVGMDPPEHTRYRRLLAGYFTLRRMRLLEETVQDVVSDVLNALDETRGPIDIVSAFSVPVSHVVMCKLLGIPDGGRDEFHRCVETMLQLDRPQDEVLEAFGEVRRHLRNAIEERESNPDSGIISDLIHRPRGDDRLTAAELEGVAFLILVAGYDTTYNMISMGALTLLCHPDQLARLRAQPSLMDNAVEELLRYLTVTQVGLVRVATEPVRVGDVVIEAGESVVVSAFSANRDPRRFADPDRFDVARTGVQQLTFGHGIHQCIGAHLSRLEMKIALAELFRRYPTLRLAVPAEQLNLRTDMPIYGPAELPVEW